MAEYFTLVAVSGNNGVTVARAPGWYNSECDDGVIVEGFESEVQKVVTAAYMSSEEKVLEIIKALCGVQEFPRIMKTIREYPVEYRENEEDNADAVPC